MKICFIDTLGLPYNGETVYKRGLGGSESATAYISKELHKLGFDVTVFNNCEDGDIVPGVFDGVKYSHIRTIPQSGCDWDVVVALRSVRPFCQTQFNDNKIFPDFTNIMQNAKHKVLMMHDTFCEGDNLIEYLVNTNHIDEIFTLSDWHTSYVTTCNHGTKRNFEILKKRIFQTRNGVGVIPEWVDIKQKDPFHFVYNASVNKGMISLVTKIWPKIVEFEPRAKLTVIGGYYIFGESDSPDQQELDWRKLVQDKHHNINFTGVISQKEISDILRYATYFLYPSAFPETFGISTLEALCHNVTPITCKNGALEETALDISSYKINYTIEKNWSCPWLNEEEQVEHFVNLVKWAMATPYLQQQKAYSCNQVKGICGWDTVALQWKQHIYKKLGQYLPVEEYRKVNKINKKVSKVFGKTWVNQVEKTEPKQKETTQFVIVTPVYNAEKYIERCIMSVASQDYDNWEMWIIDDCSTDNTVKVIEGVLNSLSSSIEDKIYLIKNSKRQGAVRNQVITIVNDIHCHEDQVVMLLDGDDWLVNDPTIFDKYNALYIDGAEFTYGSCWSVIDNIPLISQEYPEEIKRTKNYRQYKFNWGMPYTHFRTFKAQMLHSFVFSAGTSPFKNSDGEWYKAGGDNSVFYYMIEAANPDNVICVPDVVYCYNDANPLCDYKVNGEEQNNTAKSIVSSDETVFDNNSDLALGYIDRDWPAIQDQITKHVKDWSVCVQAGGHFGLYPKRLSTMFGTVYTFEADAANYQILLKNCANSNNIICRHSALSSYPRRMGVVRLPGGNSGMNVVVPGDDVETITIDSLKLPSCGLIQLDIERHEIFALMGAQETIERYKPVIILEEPETTNNSCNAILDQLGYEFVGRAGVDSVFKYTGKPPTTKEYVGEKKILIAIPTAKYIETDTFKSIFDLKIPEGYTADYQHFYGYRVDQVRNLIADWAIRGYDYVFFVDHDITFDKDTLQKLLSHDKDIVTGVYRQRNETQNIEIYDGNLQRMNSDYLLSSKEDLLKIGGCGFGCVLVKSEVLSKVGYPQFEYHVALDHNNTFSEDVDFCKKVIDKDFTIWCDKTILCGHIGTKTFNVVVPMA